MRGSHDGSEWDVPRERANLSPDEETERNATIERAAAGWLRRGYTVRYRDAHLVQLVRAGRPTCLGMLLIALAAPALALAIVLLLQGLRRRNWHTISITVTPDHRVITHRQWAPYPPEEP